MFVMCRGQTIGSPVKAPSLSSRMSAVFIPFSSAPITAFTIYWGESFKQPGWKKVLFVTDLDQPENRRVSLFHTQGQD